MLPVQLTIRNMPISATIETHIRKKVNKLHQFYNRISSCRIVVEVPQKHKHQGKLYNVRIDLTVPGTEIVVTHKCNEDIYIAIRDAFNAISRKLEDHSCKRHGRVKTHHDVLHGRVLRIVPQEGYGFIEGNDGNEYYFSVTNVSYPTFDKLLIGDAVEYTGEAFGDGQQAHHVIRERHHHEAA
jgi:ribosomal subunit interface protein